jgi:hypothetical protein
VTSLMATNFKCADDAYACLSSSPSMSRPLTIGIGYKKFLPWIALYVDLVKMDRSNDATVLKILLDRQFIIQ